MFGNLLTHRMLEELLELDKSYDDIIFYKLPANV